MALSLFWGDLHRHSSEGDGRDPLVKHFATARDFLRLDFMAMTNCGILTRDPMDRSFMRALEGKKSITDGASMHHLNNLLDLHRVRAGGITFDPASTASLRAAARFDTALLQQVTLREWLLSLVPVNPIRAAADGALLPLVVLSLAYGLALSRVGDSIRRTHVLFCEGVVDAMTTVIRWVLAAAPIGIFALAMSVGAHLDRGRGGRSSSTSRPARSASPWRSPCLGE